MAPDLHLRIALLHSIGWMFFHRNTRHLWRADIDSHDLALPNEVQQGSSFSTPSGEEHLVIGGVFQPLDILSIDDETHDHSAHLRFTFQERTLRTHLEATDRLALVDLDHLITTFLREASRFGSWFKSYRDGGEAVGSLPITQSVFRAPPHFQNAIDALCRSAFCAVAEDGYLWTASVLPYMEAAHLWSGERTREEIREAELMEIWNTMPPRIKSVVAADPEGGLDVLTLAMAMTHFWYNGRWHEQPEYEDRLGLASDGLKGEHISTAREMWRLYADGKLED